MHQTIGDILRVTLHTNPPTNINDTNQCINNALATYACHEILCERYIRYLPRSTSLQQRHGQL